MRKRRDTAPVIRASVRRQDGPLLGTHQRRRAPHTTGLSLDSALGSNRTCPTDAGRVIENRPRWFAHKNWFVVGLRSLTKRA